VIIDALADVMTGDEKLKRGRSAYHDGLRKIAEATNAALSLSITVIKTVVTAAQVQSKAASI